MNSETFAAAGPTTHCAIVERDNAGALSMVGGSNTGTWSQVFGAFRDADIRAIRESDLRGWGRYTGLYRVSVTYHGDAIPAWQCLVAVDESEFK